MFGFRAFWLTIDPPRSCVYFNISLHDSLFNHLFELSEKYSNFSILDDTEIFVMQVKNSTKF